MTAANSSITAAWITAIATVILALFGLGVFWQIRQSRKSRDTEVLMDLGRRWDDPLMIRSRTTADELARNDQLEGRIRELFESKNEAYYELLREPGYLEDLGVIYYRGGVSSKMLFDSLGLLIKERWQVWEPALAALGEMRGTSLLFSHFREMALQLSPGGKNYWVHRHRANRDSKRAARGRQT